MNLENAEIEKLKEIIAEILEVETHEVGLDTDLVEELDADSMMALEIMATIEKEFNINIPEDELPNFGSLREIADILKELKVAK